MGSAARIGSVTLDYRDLGEAFWQDEKPKIENVSAAATDGAAIWTVSDEGSSIEWLTADAQDSTRYGSASSRDLFKVFPLFQPFAEKKRPEVDLEALALDGRRLWLCGAHCWADRSGNAETDERALQDERQQRRRERRTLLGFLELDKAGKIERGLCLPEGEREGSLLAAIARTPDGCLRDSLRRFSKRGGLDIEGLAPHGNTLLIGLRGPVCGGHAIVLRATVVIGDEGLAITAPLDIMRLDLGHCGIRDLLAIGDDVLVLAGPTGEAQPGDRFTVHRWIGAWSTPSGAAVVKPPEALDLTPEKSDEKPEGLALMPDGRLLVVHDGRAGPEGRLTCDVYALPG